MLTPEERADKVQRVKDLVRELNEISNELQSDTPQVQIEYTARSFDIIGKPFPTTRLEVKLSEIKTL